MCAEGSDDPDFTFAFQPIVDVSTQEILSYEALIRGLGNQPAGEVLRRVAAHRIHQFDQQVRAAATRSASNLGIGCDLNLNFLLFAFTRALSRSRTHSKQPSGTVSV